MDYFLDINGISRHSKKPDEVVNALVANQLGNEWNEKNYGLGLTAKDGNTFYTAGGYKNSYGDPSFYAGAGLRKKFGDDFYIEPGILAGLVTGYEDPLTPLLIPKLTLGIKDVGALNIGYAPEYQDNPSLWTMNLSVPFK